MPEDILKTPVLFIIFNRPEDSKRVFESIRQARPSKLFVAADGPRDHKGGEVELCMETRNLVKQIDWDCELHTLFHNENLGCGIAVSKAINWFFDQVEEGIILEDDTVPHPSFFTFCSSMLEHYRNDDRVAQINGSNFQFGKRWGRRSYYFSKYPMIWGWATWRRSWKDYEFTMQSYAEVKNRTNFKRLFLSNEEYKYWSEIFDLMYHSLKTGKAAIDTWDYQWIYTCWKHQRISITPNRNLITNIGFGADATHTRVYSKVANIPVEAMTLPLQHPSKKGIYSYAELKLFRNYFQPTESLNRIRNILYSFLPMPILRFLRMVRRRFFPSLD